MPQSPAITSSSHTNGAGKNRYPFASDIGRSSDGDRSQPWEAGQQGDARIGNPRALSELDLFERRHASKDLQAAVGDLGLAGVRGLQPGQAGDTPGRRVSRVAAVPEPDFFQPLAATHVTEAPVGHVHRHQRLQSWKTRQSGQCRVIHVLAAHRQPAQRRHSRERRESASAEVGAFAAPDVFDSLRATQRREAIVARHRALTHQHAKPWDRGDVLTALGWIGVSVTFRKNLT